MIYKLMLSNKEEIQISEREFEIFKQNIGGGFIEFKNGIVNPSFVVCAVVDEIATREEIKQLRREANMLEVAAPAPERGTQSMAEVLEKHRPDYLLESQK